MGNLLTMPLIIGIYMFISVLLLVFNILYIFMQRGVDARHERRTRAWSRDIKRQLQAMRAQPLGGVDPSHLERLAKKLPRIVELMGYHSAMQRMAKRYSAEDIREYLSQCHPSFKRLAHAYALRKDMEKASFAFVLSEFPPKADGTGTLEEILLPYLTGTSLYCRENTLRALLALGGAATIERAFEMLADQHIFHHEILMVGGLMTFPGDKEALAGLLWKHVPNWPAHMGAAVVQFIGLCGADYRQSFYDAMIKPGLALQVRLSILGYFYKYPFGPVYPLLLENLKQADGVAVELAIVSASVLAAYPGQKSIDALKAALTSRNWYVRNNAAISLMTLGVDSRDLEDVLQGKDRYALEMMCYHVQLEGGEVRIPQCALREGKEEWA